MALKSDDTAGALNVPRYFAAEKVTNFTISYNFNNSKNVQGSTKQEKCTIIFRKALPEQLKELIDSVFKSPKMVYVVMCISCLIHIHL